MSSQHEHELRSVKRHHNGLNTTFTGVEHPLSTPESLVHQYLGIKYASIPGRFRQSKLHTEYPSITSASQYGPVCPQPTNHKPAEELLFGVAEGDVPSQTLKHDEFECLNLNITSPAGLTAFSRVPVMLWIHGGGDRGAGSSWVYDGAHIVRKSVEIGKPVIIVTFNYRIGLLGFAASPMIREDNKLFGDEGVGNYGLRDQQRCLEWLHRHIGEFGGDPSNITLFGASSGAADIICHLLSKSNETRPMFARAIIQSAVFEPTLPDVSTAGWQLSRTMSSLQATDMEKLRKIEVTKLMGLGHNLRAVDDGVFFRDGWKDFFLHSHSHEDRRGHRSRSRKPPSITPRDAFLRPPHLAVPSRSRSRNSMRETSCSRPHTPSCQPLQPLIIGDCSCDSLLWSMPISLWTSPAVVRRIKAICLSLTKANNILRAYDISPYTPDEEISDRVLELVNDARIAWPTECIAENAKRERGGHGVWRYVFDQEGPSRGIPHHAADIMYLFDTVPLPASALAAGNEPEVFFDGPFDVSDDEDDCPVPLDLNSRYEDLEWETAIVDEFSYGRVRDAMQEKWIAFANGEAPWREDKVFVFGPEGETGERSLSIFEGRRRRHLWRDALEPLGHATVQKVGVELSRGPCGPP